MFKRTIFFFFLNQRWIDIYTFISFSYNKLYRLLYKILKFSRGIDFTNQRCETLRCVPEHFWGLPATYVRRRNRCLKYKKCITIWKSKCQAFFECTRLFFFFLNHVKRYKLTGLQNIKNKLRTYCIRLRRFIVTVINLQQQSPTRGDFYKHNTRLVFTILNAVYYLFSGPSSVYISYT